MQDEELLRYSRQLMLPRFDVAGQEALLASRVLVVGLGGLGSPVAMYLAAAGVGTLVLADDDLVDLSNLQRQIAHTTDRIGMHKTDSAARAIAQLNPLIKVETINQRVAGESLLTLVQGLSAIVDCTDNFSTRFALNRAAFTAKVPLVSGAAIRMEGQLSVFDPRQPDSPCYQCLHSPQANLDQSCSENGVLAPLVGVIGSLQAFECIKILTGTGTPLVGRLLLFDGMNLQFRELKLGKKPDCEICAD